MFCVTWQSLIQLHSLVLCVVLSVVGVVLHDYLLCVTWHIFVCYMVAGYKVHGPLLWGLSVGIMDCSIHWMAVESRESLPLLRFLQLMCLFAFCICLFCWKGARHCCFYIFTTNVHFPAKKRALCLVSKSSWHFAEQCANPLFLSNALNELFLPEAHIYPLTRHFRPCTTSRSNCCNHVCTYIQQP